MRRPLWIIPSLILFAAVGAPNASADSMDPCIPTTKTGGTIVLGTPTTTKPLTDSATLGLLCSYPGTLTFTLMGGDIFVPMTFTFVGSVTGPGTFPITGPIPDVAATYTWFATYTDNAGKSFKSDFEKQVVTTPEPSIGALMLAGIGFLLVMRKRCASGLKRTS
jgi:hypothetical protein